MSTQAAYVFASECLLIHTINQSQKHSAQQKQFNTKEHISHDSICIKI